MTEPTTVQEAVQEWAEEHWSGEYWPPLANLARLTEEVGELARAINQQFGDKRVKSTADARDIELELGDILFAAGCIANSTGADLDRGFARALDKYRKRDIDGNSQSEIG